MKKDAKKVEKLSIPSSEEHFMNEIDDEIDDYDYDDFEAKEMEDNNQTDKVEVHQQHPSLMCNKYEEDTEVLTPANKLASLIIHLEENDWLPPKLTTAESVNDFMNDDTIDVECEPQEVEDEFVFDEEYEDLLQEHSQEEQDERDVDSEEAEKIMKMSKDQIKRTMQKMKTINIAPGEKGEFCNWEKDVYIEEKAFPHLFPYGTGGYLSSCLASEQNMGFAVYCRNRLKSADPKFRKDQIYLFFLLLVKEMLELKNCKSTYLRQARNTPGLSKESFSNLRYDSLERYSRSFSVFKNMRGTAMYYEAAKKNLMATIRQKGTPTAFITLSSNEYQWLGLLKSVWETVNGEPATDEVIDNLSAKEKSELITDNVVQTTLHFQKRIEKMLTNLTKPQFLEDDNVVQAETTQSSEIAKAGTSQPSDVEIIHSLDTNTAYDKLPCVSYFYKI